MVANKEGEHLNDKKFKLKKLQYATTWIRKNPKRTLLVAIGMGLVILGAWLLRNNVLSRQLSEWAIDNPTPLPGFIEGVSPAPGSKNQGSSDRICITFNTRTPPLGPMTEDEEMSLFGNVRLYVDGFEANSNTGALSS